MPMTTRRGPSEKARQRAFGAMLSHAFFRFESAVTVAMTIVLSGVPALRQPLPWWDWSYWLILGLVAETIIVLMTLLDAELRKQIVREAFRQQFDARKLRSSQLRKQVEEALDYRESILDEIEREEDARLDDHLRVMARGLDDWITQIYRLAQDLDAYWQDKLIARDMRLVPAALEGLKKELASERTSSVQKQIRQVIVAKQAQWNTMKNLRDTSARARLQLENTLSAMGTIYSQVLLLGVKDVDSGRAQRLQKEVTWQVTSLQDIATTMDEVYHTSASK